MTTKNDELLTKTAGSLLEMREACAGLFRVISHSGDIIDAMEKEFQRIGLKEGFGKRAGDILKELTERGIISAEVSAR